jgi:hypothetical protein
MKIIISAGIILSILCFSYSCNRSERSIKNSNKVESKITQESDGTISLNLEKASCYSDKIDPASNTAEWDFIVLKPGRYDVWVSSITKDTMDLQYSNSVKINLLDERLEAKPIGNKIIQDAKDVHYPYYRADSYMGTFYFEEPGEYSIQLISEKVTTQNEYTNTSYNSDHTKLRSLILTPIVR